MFNESKYAPTSLTDFVFGNNQSKTEIELIVSGSIPFPAFARTGILLFGTYGTGKTTLARLLPSFIEEQAHGNSLAAAPEFFDCRDGTTGTKILNLIDKLSSLVSFNSSKHHYIILDEVDNLDKKSLASLKTAMNKPRTAFILTTNNPSLLDRGVADRCIKIEMNAAPDTLILPFAQRINADLNGNLTDDQLLAAISNCRGSFREASYSTLRAIAMK